MSLYEYRCYDCRARFTLQRQMEERNDPATCPVCGSAAKRIISVPQDWRGVWRQPRDAEVLRRTKEIWE